MTIRRRPHYIISGFGADPNTFLGKMETGGHNYTARLNSTFSPNFTGEFAFAAHLQRVNTIPNQSGADTPLVTNNFAILRSDNTIAPITQTNISELRELENADGTVTSYNTGLISFVNAPGGSLQRSFIQQGFGLYNNKDRNRFEFSARLQNNFGRHTIKYGFEYNRNIYNISNTSTGRAATFGNPQNLEFAGGGGNNQVTGYRVTNNFSVCTTRGNQIVCPSQTAVDRAALIAAQAGYAGAIKGAITADEANNNPFLALGSVRVRDFKNVADTHTNVENFYVQEGAARQSTRSPAAIARR